mgnify:CR=1 FL=1
MKTTTRYFRNALKAATQEVIDFRKKDFLEVAATDIEEGKLSIEKITESLNIKWNSPKDEDVRQIIIAAKNLCLNYDYTQKTSNNVDELTSLLFIPAVVSRDGELKKPADGQLPWIPREYLEGSIEQRFDLLNGLLDTDGSIDKEKGRISYYTVSPQLRDDVIELSLSLGFKATWLEDNHKDSLPTQYLDLAQHLWLTQYNNIYLIFLVLLVVSLWVMMGPICFLCINNKNTGNQSIIKKHMQIAQNTDFQHHHPLVSR